jgi:hypothetical protein
MVAAQLPAAAIRDTVTAVFRDPAFNRTSLLQRLGAWLLDLLEAVFSRLRPGPVPTPVFWIMVVLLGLVAAALLARTLALVELTRGRKRRPAAAGTAAAGMDAWAAARQHAARGDYTAAAHALYAALLAALAGPEAIELHESKTIGDYQRELSRRASVRLPRFRDFARTYETVIYGLGFCDQNRYERLQGLAQGMLEPGG